ncbi:membrane protein insertase YidC [uncultured Nisaea sp.]|uniref:membrane protein insertase YidC n=1 Tax=uncultured Nisaea sp. TaxID=538215 RepID=UPI0030EB5BE9|tara:strand:- start:116 stop:1867 length:1752 start_codon:yes stop_codon:yes gene_type:complete
MNEQKNLIFAVVLSVAILVGFQFFYEVPRVEQEQARQAELQASGASESSTPSASNVPSGAPVGGSVLPGSTKMSAEDAAKARREIAADPKRIRIDAPGMRGTISTVGARIDDAILTHYRESLDKDSDNIHLLKPVGAPKSYYAEFGWVPEVEGIPVPNAKTVWTADSETLSPNQPVTLTWDNGAGLTFERTYAIDNQFMFSVTQKVRNTGGEPVTLFPYGLISRGGTPKTAGFYILHEGPLGVFDETLKEVDYDDLQEDGDVEVSATGGWIGITDKYWLAALVPAQDEAIKYRFMHTIRQQDDRYQTDYLGSARAIAAGGVAESKVHLFTGAKEVKLLDKYEEEYNVANFDLAVDFGWFYFLTKPFFYALSWLHGVVGNFGIAILIFTVAVKAVFFPLANKSYKSMAKMRELTPKMQTLREQYADDKQRLNQEMMALYKKEKVNPASGCLPIIIQIPVFFSLYKVLFVSIEMRHSPFFGWIHDLSAPDPTTLFNLFGLIPWTPPAFIPMIGVWPILMGLTMFLQQRLNPQPADPIQAKVFMFLPIFFTFLLANFPAGLVIYWAWNNLLSIAQQRLIMWRMGVK